MTAIRFMPGEYDNSIHVQIEGNSFDIVNVGDNTVTMRSGRFVGRALVDDVPRCESLTVNITDELTIPIIDVKNPHYDSEEELEKWEGKVKKGKW